MGKLVHLTLAGVLVLLTGGCSLFTGESSGEGSGSPGNTASNASNSTSPNTPGAATQSPAGTAPEGAPEGEPAVISPEATAFVPEGVPGLIPPVDRNSRSQGVQKGGRSDPFLMLNPRPEIKRSEPAVSVDDLASVLLPARGSSPFPQPSRGSVGNQGQPSLAEEYSATLRAIRERSVSNQGRQPSSGQVPSPSTVASSPTSRVRQGSSSTSLPSSGTRPAGRRFSPSVQPPKRSNRPTIGSGSAQRQSNPIPASPSLAEAVIVSGVVKVDGGSTKAIVQAPNELTSRYVSVGQRLANGQVLVKDIVVTPYGDPQVILEQSGQLVYRMVGEGKSSEG